jgi:CRP/FNR family transcriptional regulator
MTGPIVINRVAKQVSLTRAPADKPVARVSGIAPLAPVVSVRDFKARCQTCSVSELCLPVALTRDQMTQFDALVVRRARLRKNATLYQTGEPFHSLYAIQLGSVKTVVLTEDGREQVTGYHILGDVIGLDGIGTGHHRTGATALEDTEICVLPFIGVEKLARTIPALQHNLHRMMSAEIAREQSVMLLLGSMRAHERLAMFLLNLADRYGHRGYSSTQYVLRMTREEIGSYLGLTLETVSRLFSRFQGHGLIQVQGRAVKVLDRVRLKGVVGERT